MDDELCRNLASVLREIDAREVELAVARRHARLHGLSSGT
jgi:hypothetical protein